LTKEKTMNVLIIGAAGKTGRLTVERAIATGHKVTAFVRNAESYRAPAANIRVVAGDATDPAKLNDAMAGQDAAIVIIGGKKPFLYSDLERNVAKAVLAAMKQNGVRRLISVSALGVGDSKSQAGLFFRNLLVPIFLRGSTPDKAAMEQAVRQSDMDFVLVRPALLNDQPAKGSARVFPHDQTAHKITRGDVAQFLVDQLQSNQYLGQTVTIANE
jgi:uncharacterized protein YbjT (DUF2867 family)